MFNRVVWELPRNDLVETSRSSSCLVICKRAFGVAAMVLAVYENEFRQAFFVWVSSSRIVATLHITVGFHFLLVKCVLKYGADHTWQRTSASLIYERFHGH